MKKKMICLFLGLVMLMSAACTTVSDSTAASPEVTDAAVSAVPATAASDAGRDTVIAEIGTERTVTYGELADYYDYYVEMLSYYGGGAPSTDEEIEELQDMLLSDLVNQGKLFYFAGQMGLTTLTAEEQAEVEAQAKEEMESYLDEFRATAQEEGAADVEARAREIFDQDLIDYGINMNTYEYEEYLVKLYSEDKYLEKLENHVRATATATDEDARAYYDTLVTDQTTQYTEDPAVYGEDAEYYDKFVGTPCVVVPKGYVRVKVITVLPDGAIDASYSEKIAQMAEYEAEYGKLALSGENSTRMKEIATLYAALKLETETLKKSFLAAPKEKAEKAYAELESGKSFDEVLLAYGEDTDYTNYPVLLEKGRPLYLLGTDENEAVLREAAKTLKPGEYSGILETDSAMYILYTVKEETAGTLSYDSVKDVCLAGAAEQKGSVAWEEQQALWEEDDSMVKTYPERYRSLGK